MIHMSRSLVPQTKLRHDSVRWANNDEIRISCLGMIVVCTKAAVIDAMPLHTNMKYRASWMRNKEHFLADVHFITRYSRLRFLVQCKWIRYNELCWGLFEFWCVLFEFWLCSVCDLVVVCLNSEWDLLEFWMCSNRLLWCLVMFRSVSPRVCSSWLRVYGSDGKVEFFDCTWVNRKDFWLRNGKLSRMLLSGCQWCDS